ncbi:MAG: T9SS type A sorting domain-containing protein [Saprospiraceae bacterium]
MKSIYLLLSFLFIINTSQAQTTYFVKSDATGANNGTSWGDAFNDLQDALTNATLGDQIWVASGTYLPGTTDLATFHLTTDIQLYGGFTGTESSIDDRVIENNPTILSGDLNGDDVEDDFVTNRIDNTTHIMLIESTVTTATIIDGFIFEGGHADDETLPDFIGQFGGGVWSFGAPQIFNCTFQQNYADLSGGGFFFRNEFSEGGKVVNCIFEDNNTGERGAGLTASFVSGNGIEIEDCQFINNHAGLSGGSVFLVSTNGTIINSFFSGNSSNLAAGAVFINQTVDSSMVISNTIQNCIFENNESSNAGGLGIQSFGENHNYRVLNCTFEENGVSELLPDALRGGGALFFFNFSDGTTALVDSCHFENNESDSLGGAIMFYDTDLTTNNNLDVRNTTFQSNKALYGAGIATEAKGMNQEVSLSNCEFLNNEAEFFGGGYRTESDDVNLQIIVDECIFEGNSAIDDAGGFEVAQLGEADLNLQISNTHFLNNTSGNEGAGVNFATFNNGSATIDISHSLFDGNTNDATGIAEEGAGGFSLINFGNGVVELNFESTIFSNNSSMDGAGAIQLLSNNEDMISLNNCLLVDNSGGDYGGGIGMIAVSNLSILNTTIANNNSGITNANGELELQNTLLYNPESTDYMEIGPSTATSLGGNLIGDESLSSILLSTDQFNVDPLFVGNGDYQLQASSPAVDGGLGAGVTAAFDLAGNARVQGNQVDVGAYESPFTVSTKGVVVSNQALNIYPNPATEFLNILLENNWRGDVQVDIVNILGQKIFTTQFAKADDEHTDQMMISQLKNGTYQFMLSNGQEVIVKTFTKVTN